MWHNKQTVLLLPSDEFHGVSTLLSDMRFLMYEGIPSYFVTRNSMITFTGAQHWC